VNPKKTHQNVFVTSKNYFFTSCCFSIVDNNTGVIL